MINEVQVDLRGERIVLSGIYSAGMIGVVRNSMCCVSRGGVFASRAVHSVEGIVLQQQYYGGIRFLREGIILKKW